MRFAHLADVHIGAWRDPSMKELSLEAFRKAVSIALDRKLDFVIISGDLFNTALPAIDHLREAVILLKTLKNAGLAVYVVPGSHDYNAAGKSILDVLEEAELLVNVMKGEVIDGKLRLMLTIDKKTGAKITGICGKKGNLEHKEYRSLDISGLQKEPGFKIFVFHSAVDELKPDDMKSMESLSVKELPKGFDYYAGGHVHIVASKDLLGYPNIVYPGPVFPANFSELWKLTQGGFYIYDDSKLEFVPLITKKVCKALINADNKVVSQVNDDLLLASQKSDVKDSIVLLRIEGKLKGGKPGDLDFRNAFHELYSRGAFFVMRSTSQLSSLEFEQVQVRSGTADEVEEEVIRKHAANNLVLGENEYSVIKSLIGALSSEQRDGEKKYEYDSRIKKEVDKLLGL
jgi:DNA repair protein SbcD/Mre11